MKQILKSMFGIFSSTYKFLKRKKKYWVFPFFITLFLIILLSLFGEDGDITPFIYSIFES